MRLLVSKVKGVEGRARELAVQAVTGHVAATSPQAFELLVELLEAELDPANGNLFNKGVLRVLGTDDWGAKEALGPQERGAVWSRLMQALVADRGETGGKEAKLAALVRVLHGEEVVQAVGRAITEALGPRKRKGQLGLPAEAQLLAAAEVLQRARSHGVAEGWGPVAQQLTAALTWVMHQGATTRGQGAGSNHKSKEKTPGHGEWQ